MMKQNEMISSRRLSSLLSSLCVMTRKQFFGVLFLATLVFLSGCGGGGGVYYPPEIAVNTLDLHKVELSKTDITSYEQQLFPLSYADIELWDSAIEEGRKIFGTSGYFQEVQFLGSEYYLHQNRFFMQVDMIRKKDMKKHLELMVPRGIYAFASFPITMGTQNFLVVYVEQRPTSHSSTLFIIDSQFKIVYKEHLLGAEGIGYTHSDRYGNCIVLKSENFWFPNGTDKPQVSINGDWLYYILDETAKDLSSEQK